MWGAPDGAGLSWIDPPPEAAMRVARRTLAGLGLVEDGAVTALGRAVAALPAGVREARALLAAARRIGIRRAAEAAALLTADLRAPAADLTALARRVREGGAVGRAWRAEAKRLEAAASRADSAAVVAAPPAPSSAPTPVPAGGGGEVQVARVLSDKTGSIPAGREQSDEGSKP